MLKKHSMQKKAFNVLYACNIVILPVFRKIIS